MARCRQNRNANKPPCELFRTAGRTVRMTCLSRMRRLNFSIQPREVFWVNSLTMRRYTSDLGFNAGEQGDTERPVPWTWNVTPFTWNVQSDHAYYTQTPLLEFRARRGDQPESQPNKGVITDRCLSLLHTSILTL